MVQPTPEIETFISGVICLLSKGGRCAHHWAQGVIFYKKVVELLVGFLFGCFFFWWFDVVFFLDVFSFFYFERFSMFLWCFDIWTDDLMLGFYVIFFLKGSFLMIFGDLMLNLLWWFPMILDDFLSWCFDVGFSGCFYMIFFDLMIRCWIFLEIHFSGRFCKDEKPAVHFFGWNERDRGNNLMMSLRQVDMISLVSWFWSSESIYLDSFWFDSRLFSERENTYCELGNFSFSPREKKQKPSLWASLPFSQHHIKHLKKIGSAGCENCGPEGDVARLWDH